MPLLVRTSFNHLPVHGQSFPLLHCPEKQSYGTSEPHPISQLPSTLEESKKSPLVQREEIFFLFTAHSRQKLYCHYYSGNLITEAGTNILY